MWTICKKELSQFLNTSTGFFFTGIFVFLAGVFFSLYQLNSGIADFSVTLSSLELFFLLGVPLATMNSLAGETKQNTDKLLFTSPCSVTCIITGKFLAIEILFFVSMILILPLPIITGHLLKTTSGVSLFWGMDTGRFLASFLGFFLEGSCYLALGLLISGLTESPAISASLSFLSILLLTNIDGLGAILPNGKIASLVCTGLLILATTVILYRLTAHFLISIIGCLILTVFCGVLFISNPMMFDNLILKITSLFSISKRFRLFSMGLISTGNLFWIFAFIFLSLFCTVQLILRRRWR